MKLYFFALFNILSFFGQTQCLSGSYTIGGTNPSYATFAAAVSDLAAFGVCGPVTFNVRNGIYNEQLVIDSISGASGTNNIVFQSQSGVNTSVKLSYPSSTSLVNNYVVKLSASKFISFLNLTIERGGTNANARVFEFSGGACFNTIQGNNINSGYTGGNNSSGALIYSGSSLDTSNLFSSNLFTNGTCGIYLKGVSSSSLQKNNTIYNNHFDYQSGYGVYVEYQSILSINGNNFVQDTTLFSSSFCAVYAAHCYNSMYVTNNKIVSGSAGIVIQNCSFGGFSMELTNNFIKSASAGIDLGSVNWVLCSNNSVNSGNTCISLGSCNNIGIKNNIFCCYGGNSVMNIVYSSTGSYTSDYNYFYTSGANFAFYNSTTITTGLLGWQNFSANDSHSYFGIPPFVSSSDLHILYDNHIKQQGTNLYWVTDDIDYDNRNNPPDKGADEFLLPLIDAGANGVDISPSLCSGIQMVYASIYNFGRSVLDSVIINWSVDGQLQSPFFFVGSIPSFQKQNMIAIGSYNFIINHAHLLKIWTSNPNGVNDPGPLNDTIVSDYTPVALSGSYTIGGASPDYMLLNDAVNDLNSKGICGPVVFNIRNGTYTQNMILDSISGQSTSNTITFQSESGDSSLVKIYSVLVSGSSYVFNRITIMENPATTVSGYTVAKLNGNNINIENCRLIGVATNTATNTYVIQDNSQNNSITKCVINYGAYGVYSLNQGSISIVGNIFTSQCVSGIYLQSAGNFLIDKNVINIHPSSSLNSGIYIYQIGTGLAPRITNNIVYGSGHADFGILVSGNGTSATKQVLLSNNMISILGASNNTIGLYCGLPYTKVFNNSIYIKSPSYSPNTLAISAGGTGTTSFNNVFVNVNGGGAASISSTSDYNSYYSNNSNLVGNGSTMFSSLSAFQNANPGQDLNSVSILPNFISPANLHINSAPSLSHAGLYLVDVPNDIDGDMRNIISPDIGADEFSVPITCDISSLFLTIHQLNLCDTLMPVYMTFRNIGTDTITSLDILWKINGIPQPQILWTGNLIQGDSVANFLLGNYLFSRDTSYSVDAWTQNPNGNIDGNPANDHSFASLSAISKTILNAEYPNLVCPSQPFVFDGLSLPHCTYSWLPASIMNSPFNENTTATISSDTLVSLIITDNITGCSSIDTFHLFVFPNCCLNGNYTVGGNNPNFKTLTNVTNVLSSANLCGPIIFSIRPGTYNEKLVVPRVNGVSGLNTITFESQNADSSSVLIKAAPINDSAVCDINSSYVTIKQLGFADVGGIYNEGIFVRNFLRNVSILNNRVTIGTSGYATGIACYDNDSLNVLNNYVTGGNDIISIQNVSASDSIMISGNHLEGLGNSWHGITVGTTNNMTIKNNLINEAARGIELLSVSRKIRVYSNIINEFSSVGINCGSCDGINDTIKIYNNMVRASTSGTSAACGITINTVNKADIINNTISLKNGSVFPASSLFMQNSNHIRVYNNIFENQGGFTFYISPTNTSLYKMDNNIYFYSLPPIGIWGPSGSDTISNFSSFRVHTGYEQNGLATDPQFYSYSDCHLGNASSPAIDAGRPIAWLLNDIDNQLRNSIPDIGADEYAAGVGMHEVALISPQCVVFPNPAQDFFTIDNLSSTNATIKLYDYSGRLVMTQKTSSAKTTINTSSLQNGVFMAEVLQQNGNRSFQRLVIQK